MEKVRTNEEMLVTLSDVVIESLTFKLKEYKEKSKDYSLYQMEAYKANFDITATDIVLEYFNKMLEKFINGTITEIHKAPFGDLINIEELNKHVYKEIEQQISFFIHKEIYGVPIQDIDLEIIRLKLFYLKKLKRGI